MATFGLFQCFNGNFAASTRMLFAFSRNGSLLPPLGRVHPRFQTPSNAVLALSAGTLAAIFLGDSLLVPVTEVGSGSSAFGWLTACVSFLLVLRRGSASLPRGSKPLQPSSSNLGIIAAFGALAALALVLMKFLPIFPGHFSVAEYVALAIWLLLGLALRRRP
jgi:basic amino acid/polyamine antiporter, APA family